MIGATMSMKTDSKQKNKKSKTESDFCIVSEYLKGGSLRSYLEKNRKKKLPLNIVIRFALDIAKGGEVGTLGYMAPEVLSRKPYSHKCDVYGFGICLWEILCCDMAYTYDLENIPSDIYKYLFESTIVGSSLIINYISWYQEPKFLFKMPPKRSEGEVSNYPFFEGDGSSSDDWRDYDMAGDDYEGPPEEEGFVRKEGFCGEEDNIVIEEEEGFVRKGGFCGEEDNIEDVVVKKKLLLLEDLMLLIQETSKDIRMTADRMRIEQYIQMMYYALWDIIENGNFIPKTQTVNDVETVIPPTTADEKLQRRNEGVNTANRVNTASSQVNAANASNIDNLSDAVICAFLWQMAMLTMRARIFLKNKGRKLNLTVNDSVAFDKSKVECYNCHKRGHFARECQAPRGHDNKNRDVIRKTVPVETPNSSALVSCDGLEGYD
nr:serine/threonine-protein kinase STY8 [Tanacetum cinerariifolium]